MTTDSNLEEAISKTFLKIVVVGDSGVGKTSVIQRLTREKFDTNMQPTMGADFTKFTMGLDGVERHVQIWDTAGQELFRTITRSYYQDAIGAVFIFDVGKTESFNSLAYWIKDVQEVAGPGVAGVILGNKTDMDERSVDQASASHFAASREMLYFEGSALTGDNIHETFCSCLEMAFERFRQGRIELPQKQESILNKPAPVRNVQSNHCC